MKHINLSKQAKVYTIDILTIIINLDSFKQDLDKLIKNYQLATSPGDAFLTKLNIRIKSCILLCLAIAW